VTFATAAPLQEAIGSALRLPDQYFEDLIASYRRKRDRLCAALSGAGLRPLSSEGTYYAMAEIPSLGFADDLEFCRFLTTQVGVAAIPPSAFYCAQHKHHGNRFARFAFCKSDPVLDAAAERLARWAQGRQRPSL
jgi:N-succinyldiaminopimelate aminotransferase